MTRRIINIGAAANDKSGDLLRTAFDKANQNFAELYMLTELTPNGTKASNATGTAGQTSYDANYFYVCIATNTWRRVALGSTY